MNRQSRPTRKRSVVALTRHFNRQVAELPTRGAQIIRRGPTKRLIGSASTPHSKSFGR
jgi:hypothetical protein